MDNIDDQIREKEHELDLIWNELHKATSNKDRKMLICFYHAFKEYESKIIELKDLKKSLEEC